MTDELLRGQQERVENPELKIAEFRRQIIEAAGKGLEVSVQQGNTQATHQFLKALTGAVNINIDQEESKIDPQ